MKFIKPDFLRARAINNSPFAQILRALKFLDGEGATNITWRRKGRRGWREIEDVICGIPDVSASGKR